ncbi:MAG TPA: class I SAM-dependent methyltransferase [Stellaceae bacterium]|nr:class I SAM-dependent methyltransferase [Stellaceae bacterium]
MAASSGATLIFPATVPAAARYVEEARERGEEVVVAASVRGEETLGFEELILLPSIYDADFAERLRALIAAHDIRRIFSPVAVVHVFLRRLLAEKAFGPRLVGTTPVAAEMESFRRLLREAERHRGFIAAASEGRSRLDLLEIAAILRQADRLYGQSSAVKIAAMIAVCADTVPGDVVEIGSLVGRTAFVLAHLARRLAIGPVLAIDPWDAGAALQKDAAAFLKDSQDSWDFELCFQDFVTNLIPVAGNGFGFLRMPATEAYRRYAAAGRVESPWFGPVDYSGRISVLHIDGNHDFAAVSADCALWVPHIVPGGWLILDDYVWAHGDGPQRVGDALLAREGERIERAFVCGKALFLRFRP